MKSDRRITRRSFLGGALAAPFIVPASVFGRGGRPAPGSRITVGLIGAGFYGTSDLNAFLRLPDTQVVAVCDVDAGRKSAGLEHAKHVVEKYYFTDSLYKGCFATRDFRELCARKDVDAVVVATPDHWHALCSLEALKNGKDVYCEKPVVHLWAEGPVVREAVKKHDRIWQTGSQQRSDWHFRRAVELVLNGLLGKIKHVDVGVPRGFQGPSNPRPADPPPNLDYDFWCGPSKKLPYYPDFVPIQWRWNLNYGGGQLMDWIGHHNDIAQWGLGMDASGPVAVEAAGFVYPTDKTLYDAPIDVEVKCTYADGLTTLISSKNTMGVHFIGSDGWVYVNRGKLEASKSAWTTKEFDPGKVKVSESESHARNFIDGVKNRKPCLCPFDTSFRSITPGLLGYVSQALGNKKLTWDPKAEKIVGDDAADRMLKAAAYRDPWKLS